MNNLEYLAGLSGYDLPKELEKCNHQKYCIMKGCNGYRDCKQIKKFYDKYGYNYFNTKPRSDSDNIFSH